MTEIVLWPKEWNVRETASVLSKKPKYNIELEELQQEGIIVINYDTSFVSGMYK